MKQYENRAQNPNLRVSQSPSTHGKPRPSEAVAKRQTGFDEDQKAVVSVIGETDFPRRRIAVPNKFVDIVGVHAAKGLFA
ncbi:MAG: hypothetical protein WA191_24450 [Telluria sp.]